MTWTAVLVLSFVLVLLVGNFMAALPDGQEQQLAQFRQQARTVGFFLTLSAPPDWLAKDSPQTLMQYTLTDDAWVAPLVRYLPAAGHLTALDEGRLDGKKAWLDGVMLPPDFAPFIYGVAVQANGVVVFLDDKALVKQWLAKFARCKDYSFSAMLIELKETLVAWGNSKK